MKDRRAYQILIVGCLACWTLPAPALAMRQYAAKQQRFMQRDPIALPARGSRGTSCAGCAARRLLSRGDHGRGRANIEAYLYISSNPMRYRDQSGLLVFADPTEPPCSCIDWADPDWSIACSTTVCDGSGNYVACKNPNYGEEVCGPESCLAEHEDTLQNCMGAGWCAGVRSGEQPPAIECDLMECEIIATTVSMVCLMQEGYGDLADRQRRDVLWPMKWDYYWKCIEQQCPADNWWVSF